MAYGGYNSFLLVSTRDPSSPRIRRVTPRSTHTSDYPRNRYVLGEHAVHGSTHGLPSHRGELADLRLHLGGAFTNAWGEVATVQHT